MAENRKNNLKKRGLLILFSLLLLAAVCITALIFRKTATQREDYRRIAGESYDTVFLSMYSIAPYHEEDYTHYRAMTILKTEHILSDSSELNKYMKRIAKSGNTISTVYLGVRPDKISASAIRELAETYPSVSFEVIVSYPSAAYWQCLPESEYLSVLASYCEFLENAHNLPGTRLYFYSAEEWLIANPALYQNDFLINEDAARFIMTNSDYLHPYQVTSDTVGPFCDALGQLTASLRDAAYGYPDYSDTAVIFFGDSIIGNYTDGMSIPGVVGGLTNATVYNCGYGGNSAAMAPDIPISLPGIVEAFFEENPAAVPTDKQVYQGLISYLENPPAGKKLCFVINYGLNDYFKGYPIFSENPYDITTYTGAVRTAVSGIRRNAPDARIILCTPTYSAATPDVLYTDCGYQALSDYADAILALGKELDVTVVDNFYTLGIDSSNYMEYMPDSTHPNEKGRFMIALKLIEAIH